jgi:hypothetical protein
MSRMPNLSISNRDEKGGTLPSNGRRPWRTKIYPSLACHFLGSTIQARHFWDGHGGVKHVERLGSTIFDHF